MKKLFGLLLTLLLASCGADWTAGVFSDRLQVAAGDPAAAKVTVQSILAEAGKDSYRNGELIVKYKSGIRSASSSRLQGTLGTSKIKGMPLLNAEQVRLPVGLTIKDAITLYMQDPDVEYAEPNYIRSVRSTFPNDPLFSTQWALNNRLVPGADMHMPQAWDLVSGNSGFVIAVIDTGIDYTHPDLAGNIWSNPGDPDCASGSDNDHNGFVADCRGWNFVGNNNNPRDDDGHGTHVSGIIGAVGNNGIGIAGLIWNVKLMPLKILDAQGEGTVADEASAIEYAIAKGAKVINASFAGDTFSNTERSAISAANASGILFVTAAGNGDVNSVGGNNDVTPVYPGNYDLPNIISVAATDEQDMLASFSNYGGKTVQVAAPGVDIVSTVPPALNKPFCGASPASGYELCAGTSMSTPHVAGLTGLLESYYPNFSYQQVRATILRYVDLLPTLKGRTASGGRVNAYKALSSLLAPDGLSATAESSSSVTLNWTDHATGEDGYIIDREAAGGGFSEIDRVGAGVTTYRDNKGLLASTTYAYRVSAFNTIPASSAYSNEATATTAEGPQPPPPAPSGGGGGCSVAGGGAGSEADALVFMIPLLAVYIMKRLHGRKK
jgi:subtilisin family serine protease